MKRILVTGSKGQLGSEFFSAQHLYPHHQFTFFSKEDLDISNEDAVQTIFKQLKPHFCINCAAYTAVDKAETEIDKAYQINDRGVENLAKAAFDVACGFVHISTDYVFDGESKVPYKETHRINPVNEYGRSKAAGEAACLSVHKEAIIIRTSWVYSQYGNNFVKTMLRLMQTKEQLNVVADQWGNPTYAADLAEAILQMIDLNAPSGLYHFSNNGPITWYDFARQIATFSHSTCTIHPITTDQYPTPAKRPQFSSMDLTKISALGIPIKSWEESLHHCMQKISTTNQ